MRNVWINVTTGLLVGYAAVLLFQLLFDSELEWWLWTANRCYGIAHRFGSMGMYAETKYNRLCDEGRMI